MRLKRSDALALTLLALGAAWTHSRAVRNGPDPSCPACLFPASSSRDTVGCCPVAPAPVAVETGQDCHYPTSPGTQIADPDTFHADNDKPVAKKGGPR
jgi:hypothetical protein